MIRTSLMALAVAALPTSLWAEKATYVIDDTHAVIAFLVNHIGYAKVLGRFSDVEGSFAYDAETQELSDVTVTIGTASVDTDHEARDGHVRSADFLDAEAHPQITFTADGGTPTSETTGTVDGVLTVRGVEVPVTLDVTMNKIANYPFGHGKETIGLSIRASVMRSDFGMTYAVAGDIVADQVDLLIEVEAIRQD